MRKIQIGLSIAFSIAAVFFVGSAQAEIKASEYTQTRIVEIHSLDHSDTTAIMSGYRYSFKGVSGWDLPTIRLYGTDQ
jgi:hypothetical protein